MRWLKGLFAVICVAAWGVEPPLRVGVGNSPPYSFLSQGQPSGIEIDLLHELERIDPSLHFIGLDQFLTVKRVIEEVNAGRLDLALSAKTPERVARYEVLEPAIHTVRLRLLGRQDESLQVSSFTQLAALGQGAVVLAIPGSSPHALLLKQPGLVLDAAPINVEQMLQKLVLGRGRFAFGLAPSLQAAAAQSGLTEQLRWQPLDAGALDIHLLASRTLPAERLARLNIAWKKLAASPKLKEIVSRYAGENIVETP